MILTFLSMLVPLLTGSVLVYILWPNQGGLRHHFFIKGSIAAGTGFGISSLFFFFWLLIFGSSDHFTMFEEALLVTLLASGIIYAVKTRRGLKPPEVGQGAFTEGKAGGTIRIGFYIAFFTALVASVLVSLKNPHGGWDGWAIWNMHARFIFRAGDYWKSALSNLSGWSHPDYPLLIPLSIARGWAFIGSDKTVIPVVLALCFTFSTVLLIFSSLTVLRGEGQGLLAGLVLLGTPFFIRHGASQYADVPLGLFMLSTIVLLTIYDRSSARNDNLLFLAGMTAGFSAWTKNEGLVFLAATIVTRSFLVWKMRGRKETLKEMVIFSVGLLPVLVAITYFKTNIAPSNDILSSQGAVLTVDRLEDLSRYLKVLKAYAAETIGFTGGAVSMPLLTIYLLLVGIEIETKDKVSLLTSASTLSIVLVSYFFIFIITPLDLTWHLKYSLNRLFLQLWPSFVFCFFMIVKPPKRTFLAGG